MRSELGGGWRLLLLLRRSSSLLLLLLALLLLLKQGLSLGRCDEPGHMLTLDPVKLRDPAPCMLQPVPGHLQHLLTGIAATFMGLSCAHLAEILYVFSQATVDVGQRVHELSHQQVNLFLTGFVFGRLS